jgi:hypothetical protein
VAIGELPRDRSTILIRLLGKPAVRRQAQRDLAALSPGAWETQLALPWLIRLSFEVPIQGLGPEERELVMETREWFEEWHRKNVDEPLQAAAAALHAAEEAAKRAEENAQQAAERERAAQQAAQQAAHEAQVQMTAQLFALRLGRPVTEAERATLAERLRTLGQEQVGKVVIERSADAAAAWLAHPNAR